MLFKFKIFAKSIILSLLIARFSLEMSIKIGFAFKYLIVFIGAIKLMGLLILHHFQYQLRLMTYEVLKFWLRAATCKSSKTEEIFLQTFVYGPAVESHPSVEHFAQN